MKSIDGPGNLSLGLYDYDSKFLGHQSLILLLYPLLELMKKEIEIDGVRKEKERLTATIRNRIQKNDG